MNAHGSGHKLSDLAEARAFQRVFGPGKVPGHMLKGYMGNLSSGCGSVELIGSLVGVNRGMIPQVLNCDEPDPECGDLDLVLGAPRRTENSVFVTTNLTPNGQAAAIVVKGERPTGSN